MAMAAPSWFDQFETSESRWFADDANPTSAQGAAIPPPYVVPGAKDANGNPFPGASTGPQEVPNPPGMPGSTPPTSTAPAGGQVTMQQFSDAWNDPRNPYPGTVDGLKAFMAANPQYAAAGITLGGSKGDKVYGPGGAYWGDAVIAAGAGGQGKSRLSGETGGGLGSVGSGAYTQPWTEGFQPRDPSQIANDPAYQFQLGEGMNAIQRSAAARGTLLTGGTLKGLERFGQGLASTYNDKYYGRDLGEYQMRYGIFKENQDRPFDKNYSLAHLGKPG
jgi:hypothetical protein